MTYKRPFVRRMITSIIFVLYFQYIPDHMYQKLRNDMNEQDKPLYEDEPNVIASPNSPMVMHFHEKITFLT